MNLQDLGIGCESIQTKRLLCKVFDSIDDFRRFFVLGMLWYIVAVDRLQSVVVGFLLQSVECYFKILLRHIQSQIFLGF